MSADEPWVVPELLAEEMLEDAVYLFMISDERRKLLDSETGIGDSDAGIFVSNELIGLLRMAVIMTNAGMEALANQELSDATLFSGKEYETLDEKWSLLYRNAGLPLDKGERPWQSIPKLVDLRNKFVHHVPTDIILAERPLGSLKMKLIEDGGVGVRNLLTDAVEVAITYLSGVGKQEEANGLRLLLDDPEEVIFRSLPWEVPSNPESGLP